MTNPTKPRKKPKPKPRTLENQTPTIIVTEDNAPERGADGRLYPLTLKQEAFARAYVETGNATEAYRRAGYSQNMTTQLMHQEASRLLDKPKVAARVDELRHQIGAKNRIDGDWLAHQWQTVFALALRAGDFNAANRAAELLGKLTGELADKSKHEHKIIRSIDDIDPILLQDALSRAAQELGSQHPLPPPAPDDEEEPSD